MEELSDEQLEKVEEFNKQKKIREEVERKTELDIVKQQWITQWLIAFTASYSAQQYDHNYQVGWREKEQFIHPEDAYHLAEKSYERYKLENRNADWEDLIKL